MQQSELNEHYRARLQELREFSPVDVIEERDSGWLVLCYWPGGQQVPMTIAPPREKAAEAP